MGILEKIAEIELEIARTQKNKATNYHIGLLKAKLSKYRSELLDGPKGTQKGGDGFDVLKVKHINTSHINNLDTKHTAKSTNDALSILLFYPLNPPVPFL